MIDEACKDCRAYACGWCEYDPITDTVYPADEGKCRLKRKERPSMREFDPNQFVHEVHRNAVEHGWWDEERSPGTIRALIHCELSEAMESYRNGEALHYHKCPYHPGACEDQQPQDEHLHCEACSLSNRKPEGIAVELMDAVIRIFDFFGQTGFMIPEILAKPEKMAEWSVRSEVGAAMDLSKLDLPDLVDFLHADVCGGGMYQQLGAAGLAMAWVEAQGADPVAILLEKHEYNKTRPYRHGGKRC